MAGWRRAGKVTPGWDVPLVVAKVRAARTPVVPVAGKAKAKVVVAKVRAARTPVVLVAGKAKAVVGKVRRAGAVGKVAAPRPVARARGVVPRPVGVPRRLFPERGKVDHRAGRIGLAKSPFPHYT